MTQDLQKLTPRHYKIMDYAIRGIPNINIAKALSMSPRQVSIVMNSPSFQHQLAIRRSSFEDNHDQKESFDIDVVKQTLVEGAKQAADKLVGGLSSENENIKLKSAVEILDRTGYPKEQKLSGTENVGTQITINSIDLKNLQESLVLDAQIVESGVETDTRPQT